MSCNRLKKIQGKKKRENAQKQIAADAEAAEAEAVSQADEKVANLLANKDEDVIF